VRTKSAVLIVRSNIILQLLLVMSGLILPRYIIFTYGSEVNGLVSSIKQFLLYFNAVSSGIGVASMAALYAPLDHGNIEKINAIASASRIFFTKIGYIISSLILIFLVIYPIFITSSISRSVTVFLILVLNAEFIIEYFLLSKYRIFLNVAQKAYVILNTHALGVVIYTLVAVFLIRMHLNILIVLSASTVCYALRSLLIINYTKKHYPYLNFYTEPDFKAIPNRREAFLYKISDVIIQYTPFVVIVVILGLKKVSVYSVYNLIFVSLSMLSLVFSTGITSLFGNVIAKKNQETLRTSFRTYELVYDIMIFFCYTSALKLIIPFISIYTQGIADVEYVVPAIGYLFIFRSIFRDIRMPFVVLVDASGNFKINSVLNMVEAGVTILLSIVLCLFYGIPGILLGALITGSLRTLGYILYVYTQILQTRMIKSFIRLFLNFIFMIIIVLIPFSFETDSVLSWITLAIKVSSVTFIVIVIGNCIIDPSVTKDLITRIKYLISSQKSGLG
jgi:hypothetical protein